VKAIVLASVVAGLWLAPSPAAAGGDCTPDLEPAIATPLRTVRRPFERRARGRFEVRIDNPTSCDAAGRVAVKPIFLPFQEVITHGDHSHPSGDGRMMEVAWIDLAVPGGASRTYTIQRYLPQLDWQTWRLTAILDSAFAIGESDELDNVPDLIDAGYRGAARGNPREVGIDFTSTIRGRLAKANGGVAHTLGLHNRPASPPGVDSHDVGARFLLADVTTGKVYTLVYRDTKPCKPECEAGLTCDVGSATCVDDQGNPVPEIDKEYYALAWGGDLDELGRAVVTDIYWQAPRFVHPDGQPFVLPGDYRFLTVMDSWDRVDEFDETNNVDAVPFTLAPLEIVGFPNTWFVSTPIAADPPSVPVVLRNSYSADLAFTITVPGAPTWLTVSPPGGNLGIDDDVTITVSAARGALTPGTYQAELQITAAGYEAFPTILPVSFYVHGIDAPGITVTPATLAFETSIGVHPPPETFVLSNPGTIALDWEGWPSVEWISVSPPSGMGPPGYTEDVSIIVHPEGIAPGGPYRGHVDIFSSAPDGYRRVEATLVVAPCEQGWCNESWTCNTTSHQCEPPPPCDEHGDCAVGQHCPPLAGYCETTTTCLQDTDCDFWWSTWGALTCNEARTTCELATCAVDEDCPIASYCDEVAGTCPNSGWCTADDDCWDDPPIDFVCDEARQSCEPA
jgi:hypothetical protein